MAPRRGVLSGHAVDPHENLLSEESVTPRFEFRVFGQGLRAAGDRIRELGSSEGETGSAETYFVSTATQAPPGNVKIREKTLDIKELVESRGVLERWKPVVKTSFPLSAAVVRDTLADALGVNFPIVNGGLYRFEDLVREIILDHPQCFAAWVGKRRFRFRFRDCPVEIDEVSINGAFIRSIAIESDDPEAVLDALTEAGLQDHENVNYPRAIRRVMGLETYAGQPWHREK